MSLRDKINHFIDNHLFTSNANKDDANSSGFVFIPRFPEYNDKLIEKYTDLMNMGLTSALNQCKSYEKSLLYLQMLIRQRQRLLVAPFLVVILSKTFSYC